MPHEELHYFSDQRLLGILRASVKDAHYTVRRTQELIEQSRIMLRELDIHGADGRRNPRVSGLSVEGRLGHSAR